MKFCAFRVILSFLLTKKSVCSLAFAALLLHGLIYSNNILAQEQPIKVTKDIIWSSPKGFDLTLDIYSPEIETGKLPVLLLFHGGGWLINSKESMAESAAYLSKHGSYVVCNVNYRLLGDLNNTTKFNEIIEDAMGAYLWVKYHISSYNGNPENIAVLGEDSGGHLAMMLASQGDQLRTRGFSESALGYHPSWLPVGVSAEDVSDEIKPKAAILNYAPFDIYALGYSSYESAGNLFWSAGNAKARGFFGKGISVETHPHYYLKVSPSYNISNATKKPMPPMLFTVGEFDRTITPQSVESFIRKLKDSGHTNATLWIHKGRSHGFLESGESTYIKNDFMTNAIPALDYMLEWLNAIFYE